MSDLSEMTATALDAMWSTLESETVSASLCDGGGLNPTIPILQMPINFERGNSNMTFGLRKWLARASDLGEAVPVVGDFFLIGLDRYDIRECFRDISGGLWTFYVAPPGWVGSGFELIEREFAVPSNTWNWTHNLGYQPVVQVYDSDRNEMIASVTHVDENSLTVTHAFNATGWIVLVTNG